MSSGSPPLIAPKVHECVRRFSTLCGLLPEADRIARPALVDQLGRLKIWAGNIGAFQELPLQSSLDYRLREAPKIVDQVIELLNDLNETLQEVSSIISGERPNRVNAITDGGTEDLNSGNDDDDDTEDEASVLSDQSEPSSELEELLESSSDTITSLFKISVLVKSATTRDRYARAAKAQGEPFDARFDISHVGHKFPLVHQIDWLEKRLGKAITQRRQYLRYCREHRDKLETHHKATDVSKNAVDRQPTPTRKPVEESHETTKSQIQSLKPPSTFAITTASTLVVNNLESLEEFPDEVQSQTSYATSVNEDVSSDMLRVPPLPDQGAHGIPFECPYCWAPQLIKTRRAWKKHVFQDLKPYVCTFEECDLKIFADRSNWFSHELLVHRIEWCCPFCTHSPLQSYESFEEHLQNRHAQKFIKEQLSALGATCQQSVEKISPQACPFCDEWFVTLKDANPDLAGETLVVTPAQFQNHVGTHMEQLALFALPKDHGDAVESIGVAAGADNRSDSELGSRASYECHNNPPLHIAAYEGLEAEVLQLLKDGAKVNAPGHTWGNVLQAAVARGHVSIVQLLLEHGAEVTLYGGPYGQYCLHTAIKSGNEEIVRLLREAREKTELKSNKEVRRMYSDHEGEKQEALEITENRDISLDLETRYQIALRYPRASYMCPVCGEKYGDANQLWSQHAVSRHQVTLGVTRPDDNTEVQKRLIVSAERLSHSQIQPSIGAADGSDTVLLINSARNISIQAESWLHYLLPDDLALFSNIANVKSRLPRFIDILAKSKLDAKAGRFSRCLPLERDLKLLLQNLGRSLEVLMLTLEIVSTAVSNGKIRIKPPGDSNGFEWKCMYSLASEVYVGMDLLDSTLRKFPPTSVPSTNNLETSQSNVLQLADNAEDTGNAKDTKGAEDPGDPDDSEGLDFISGSEDPEDLEAEAFNGQVLVDHIKFIIDKAIIIDSRVQMVHRSEASTLSDAITSIQQNLPQIINTLLKMQERSEMGAYTVVVKAPVAKLLDKLPSILGKVERYFGSGDQRQARQSPNDPQADEIQQVSEMIETILVGIRKHESEISTVSGSTSANISPPVNKSLHGYGGGGLVWYCGHCNSGQPMTIGLDTHCTDCGLKRVAHSSPPPPPTSRHFKARNVKADQPSNNQSARINTEKVQDERASAPNPSFDLQSFGHGAPEGYQYQYSDCTGRRKALLIGLGGEQYMDTMEIISFLMNDYGFERDDIICLNGGAGDHMRLVTRENILKGMAWLIEGARTNDCLFFHCTGFTPTIRSPHKEGGIPFALNTVDFDPAGPITSDDMHRIMIQPLRQGVRLTALFEDSCDTSPLKTPYIYSAGAMLEEADFSNEATRTVLAQFSSNARTILRSMTSSGSSKQPSLPAYGLENLIKATKTSPADVIVIYDRQLPFIPYGHRGSTASVFFKAHRYNRRCSYADLLSRMDPKFPPNYNSIRPCLSCSHPLDMQARFIM